MSLPQQLARQFRENHFGGNTTGSHLKQHVADLTWQQATKKVADLNTVALLTFHINYYVAAVRKVLEGGPLDAHDKYSYDLPPINSQEDWEALLQKVWDDAERVAELIAAMPEEELWEPFANGKYGTNYRNFQGLIEHSYYHLGQVSLVKKMVLAREGNR